LTIDANNYTTPAAFYERNINFFKEPTWKPFENKYGTVVSTVELVKAAKELIEPPDAGAEDWTSEAIADRMKKILESATDDQLTEHEKADVPSAKAHQKAWNRAFCHFLRWVLVNGCDGPSLHETMTILGPESSIKRFRACKALLNQDAEVSCQVEI